MSKIKPPPPQSESSGARGGWRAVGWPALSKEDAKRVTELVAPKPGQHDDCLREAAISVEWIKRKTTATRSPGMRKEALLRVAKNIAAVIASLNDLPETVQREIDPKALRKTVPLTPPGNYYELRPGTLQQLHDRTIALAEKIKVTTAGGKLDSRIDAAKKRAAADCALYILKTWGSRRATLYRAGPYFELAALLFELATGKAGDVERACKARRLAKTVSARDEEMWEMLFEDHGVPKVFEDND